MAAPTRTADRRAIETRERILHAAERLFAENGFDRVALRQIARASGQRNVAAVQYHFGSKEGLLAAIVERHRLALDEERKKRLAASDAGGAPDDLGALLTILIEPLCDKLDDPSGRAYLRIQAQALHNESMRPATRRLVSRIDRSLGAFDRDVNSDRDGDRAAPTPYFDRFATLLLFHALADRAKEEESGKAAGADRGDFLAALTRSLLGVLQGAR